MSALFDLAGRSAFVTGAASGIGQRIAIGLAEAGADVACVDRHTADLAATTARIEALGRRAVALAADVTDERAVDAAVARHEAELGPLAIAVNAAGIADAAPTTEMPAEQWQRVLDVNLTGVFLCCRAQARAMLPHGRGSIVNVASISGSIVNRGLLQVHYNASKAAVIQLTRTLAVEWAGGGLRVNAISPGYTATAMNLRSEVADRAAQFEHDTPLGRMATVDEMVGPAVFLASDAAAFCTGIDLVVDGGAVLW